jgi:hypothetical protein
MRRTLRVQYKYGVKFLKYWVNEKEGAVFCLSDAPNKGAPTKAHRESQV